MGAPWHAVAALMILNCWTFLRFVQDKAYATSGHRRIPERELLFLALIGGTPAAFLARHFARHKTRKQPFSTYLLIIAGLQVGAGLGWLMIL